MRRVQPRTVMLSLAFLLVAFSAVMQPTAAYLNRERYPHEKAAAPVAGMTEAPSGTAAELSAFVTHLPIVVLEFAGEPGKHALWDSRRQYAMSAEGNPFAEGVFRLYHSDKGANRLTDAPSVETRIQARYRGLTSLNFPKKQYLIKTLAPDGSQNPVDLLDMGLGWEWVLNISHIDKSLMRNYLCLNVASRIMGYAPETRYCEAFRKRGDSYEYLGVYLLMEPVDRGDSRVKLTKYNPRHAESAYLLRRDRFQENSVVLDTYATLNKLSAGYLEVLYPGRKKITARTVLYVERDLGRLEKALYSDDKAEFLACRDMIDAVSFADYFIINEFFANYDAQWNSYYMHKNLRDYLKLGPVWDFDQSMGNSAPFVLNPRSTAMQNAVWFDRLLRDGKFLYLLKARYHQLRQNELSEKNLYAFIDEVAAYLGDARRRDWSRWRYDNPRVLTLDAGDVLHPNLLVKRTYDEEIRAMKTMIHEHGTWMDQNIYAIFDHFVAVD